MINAFGGPESTKGNTGPFWVASGLAVFSAIITFFFIRPLSHDGMAAEDEAFRLYLEENGWDTSQMGLGEDEISDVASAEKDAVDVKEDIPV